MRLQKHMILNAILTAETGLRIGGTGDKVEIGGVDNPIIRDPLTRKPYIPGSSLKGKLRTLTEYDLGKVNGNGTVWSSKDRKDPVVRLFGPDTKDNLGIGPTRLVVRDLHLNTDYQDYLPIDLVETKSENMINRLTGTAEHPRQVERVPAGVTFDMEIVFRCFDFDENGGVTDEQLFYRYIPRALELLEMDCLGGYGSRGYGKVSLSDLKLKEVGKEGDRDVDQWDDVSGFKAWAAKQG